MKHQDIQNSERRNVLPAVALIFAATALAIGLIIALLMMLLFHLKSGGAPNMASPDEVRHAFNTGYLSVFSVMLTVMLFVVQLVETGTAAVLSAIAVIRNSGKRKLPFVACVLSGIAAAGCAVEFLILRMIV